MVFNPDIHHRRSIRLRGYDYSQAGMYFVTICTQGRLCLFGDVVDGAMKLNDAGRLAHEEWRNTEVMRENIALHEFIVMPNHVHGIIEIAVGARCTRPLSPRADDGQGRVQLGRVQRAPTIGDVVRGYKSAVTKRVSQLHERHSLAVWQRNYFEHIIRDEDSYLKIAEYIQTNPQRWQMDTYHV